MKKYLIFIIVLFAFCLRLFRLDSNPPSLYWEEVAIGYDAYSILKTGKDFHGHPWPLVAFESFGDYKPSFYFYMTVPSILIFGLNEFAVRFPSAFFGALTVFLVYLLIKNQKIALISALLLAISPWHLQFSRAAFEANLGLFFIVAGIYWFKYWPLSAICFSVSMYTYHAYRIFVPLFLIAVFLIHKSRRVFFSGLLVILLILPIVIKLNAPEVRQRFNETSAFNSLEPIIQSNTLIAADGGGWLPKTIHHRFWYYLQIFLKNYFSHFNFSYLFLNGDSNPRHSVQSVGYLYLIQFPFLICGLILGLKRHNKFDLLLLSWLFIAPIPAALTLASPHGLRSLSMIIPLIIFTALGLSRLKKIFLLILFLEFSRYLYIYYQIYPQKYAQFWQTGYKSMIQTVAANQEKYNQIYITRKLGRPSIYYWFYTQTDPYQVQVLNNSVLKDQGEYLEFGKIKFNDGPYLPNSLIVSEASNQFKIHEN